MTKVKHFFFKLIIQVWKVVPFKVVLSKLINKSNNIKGKLYQDLRYKGNMDIKIGESKLVIHNPGFTTIENELFWNGLDGWEKISLDIWSTLAKDARCILDIGANSGIYSLIAATINREAEVYAFEPVKRTSSLLKTNLKLNPSLHIKLFELAVSNNNGIAAFYDVPTLSQYSAYLNEKMLENVTNRIQYEVETIRIDSIPEIINNKIDLIKIDVEMHEPEVLEGMISLIERDKPAILIEILNEEIASKVESLVKDFGYIYFSIDEENRPDRIELIGKSKMYNLLLITEEKASCILDLL